MDLVGEDSHVLGLAPLWLLVLDAWFGWGRDGAPLVVSEPLRFRSARRSLRVSGIASGSSDCPSLDVEPLMAQKSVCRLRMAAGWQGEVTLRSTPVRPADS